MKAEGLKLKVEGPMEKGNGSIGFLKRTFTATIEGVEISMNSKTRLDVCVKEAKHEIGESHRGRS